MSAAPATLRCLAVRYRDFERVTTLLDRHLDPEPAMPTQEQTGSRPQHLEALERANARRLQQAAIKRYLKHARDADSARHRLIAFLREPPAAAETLTVYALLVACRGIGPCHADATLGRARLGARSLVGHLTARQRDELIDLLGGADQDRPTLWESIADGEPVV